MSANLVQRGMPAAHVARLNGLVQRMIRIAEDDVEVAELMKRAPMTMEGAESLAGAPLPAVSLSMTDPELAARGWTRGELAIALCAMKNKREVPYFLIAAHERAIGRQKLLQAANEAPVKAYSYVVPMSPREDR